VFLETNTWPHPSTGIKQQAMLSTPDQQLNGLDVGGIPPCKSEKAQDEMQSRNFQETRDGRILWVEVLIVFHGFAKNCHDSSSWSRIRLFVR
jgi:hypothetical protein